MHYLGYPGALAVEYMDYFIGDALTIPDEGRDEFTESVIRIPGCYQCTDNARVRGADAGQRADWGLPETGFVFASFNALYKIRPEVFELWLDLLGQVDGSVLWFYAPEGPVRQRLMAHAMTKGIGPDRLIFASRVPQDVHLGRLQHVDLGLDSWPYGAHTTAADMMWAGVPLLTVCGDRFAARVATSILTACGVEQGLVTSSTAAYREQALYLARAPSELAEIRQRTAQAPSSPHFDTLSKTRHLEAAYLAAWDRHVAGLAPADIVIEGA
jgi:predicted O-linked N-acetylglucosamine transferase (SPINDLY family)